MYGSESWVWQKKNESRINKVEMRLLCSMCGVSQKDRWRNSDVREECGLKMYVSPQHWFGIASARRTGISIKSERRLGRRRLKRRKGAHQSSERILSADPVRLLFEKAIRNPKLDKSQGIRHIARRLKRDPPDTFTYHSRRPRRAAPARRKDNNLMYS
ncbi:hypothetical protein EVAR_38295_1 [Eumeta japonica]|uniref:Uncharacterized protein n=1 Tax=Eumeta variegata TaxID=151549 RepID=A0A4C1W844_EUMVA|nr:hypothetical protein EVAR_38295_1 [Eumeta japonica]